jgi:hypothetical protein
MYLASPRTSSSWVLFKESFMGRIGSYGCFYRFLLQFTDRAIVYGFLYGVSLRTWNIVYYFVCFEYCAERCLCPYHRLFSSFEFTR